MLTAFLVIAGLIGGYMVAVYFQKKDGETADQVAAANAWQPLIFEQGLDTISCRLQTVAMAEQAVDMLKKHGNKFLRAGIYPHGDVHVWIHGFDSGNEISDFSEWAYKNGPRRIKLYESFRALKSQSSDNANQTTQHARQMAGDFDEYQTEKK